MLARAAPGALDAMSGEQEREPALSQAPRPAGAVFLSYASQDAEAAQKICGALRAAGIEVWFDQSELRGGDAWDRQIRERIHDCRLFIALISAHTQARDEGYFRREWKLAVDRTHDMLEKKAFLLPVAIDATAEQGAAVPDKFHEVQWTRLPGGDTPAAFVERVQRLLSPEASTTIRRPPSAQSDAVGIVQAPLRASWSLNRGVFAAVAVVALGALAYFAIDKPWLSKPAVTSPTVAAGAAPPAFNPPPYSIAVLPFVNLSGDKEQDYLSDGITEELLNSLSRINDLHVISRTSTFAFKGKDVDVGTIARQLNVGTVLEGSVRRSGNMVRVTVQLINAVTGFHLWSQTYDRDLGDVFKLEMDIANATASALKITLLLNNSVSIELAGTLNAKAVDAYFRGMRIRYNVKTGDDLLRAASVFTEAIRLDPKFALAFAQRSRVLNDYAGEWATGSAIQDNLHKAEMDARQAIVLAPEFAAPHVVLAYYYMSALDLQSADAECARARTLEPNNGWYLEVCGNFAIQIGRTEAGLALSRQMVDLNPLNWGADWLYGEALLSTRRYEEALAVFKRVPVTELDPDFQELSANQGFAYYHLGRFEEARKSCALDSEVLDVLVCQATTYKKLGKDKEAQAALAKFMKLRGESDPYAYAEIYAQWGDTAKAMDWLRKAAAFRDTGLILLKIDPFIDPIRGEPEFKEILKSMNFPD
jgi:TolB-like protein/Flp pilus assembly protein TadD